MDIIIYNENFEQLGMIEEYTSLIWIDRYNDIGEFELTAQATENSVHLCREGKYIYKTDSNTAGIIQYYDISNDINQATLKVKGKLTIDLLSNRIIVGTQNIYNVENDLYNAVNNNAINVDTSRKISNLQVAPIQGYTDVFDTQASYKELPKALTHICQAVGYGYKMLFDVDKLKHIFTIYKGIDRSIGKPGYNGEFSEEFDNLIKAELVKDDSIYKNVAIVLGEGTGSSRKMVTVGTDKGDNRKELYVDARDISQTYSEEKDTGERDDNGNIIYNSVQKQYTDIEYFNMLKARGNEKLKEHLQVFTFNAEVKETGNMEYGKDYNLGDIVSCVSLTYGISINVRISEITTVYEDGKRIYIKFGNPENNLINLIKKGVI